MNSLFEKEVCVICHSKLKYSKINMSEEEYCYEYMCPKLSSEKFEYYSSEYVVSEYINLEHFQYSVQSVYFSIYSVYTCDIENESFAYANDIELCIPKILIDKSTDFDALKNRFDILLNFS